MGVEGWLIDTYSDLISAVNGAGYTIVTSWEALAVLPHNIISWVNDTVEGAIRQQFSHTNYSNIGIFGHSMGGGAVIRAMANTSAGLNFRAGVALHPWLYEARGSSLGDISAPLMYTTGSWDVCVPHEVSIVRSAFQQTPPPKLYANLRHATHYEPLDSPLGQHRWNPYVGAFFDCYLKSNQSACTKVYIDMAQDPNLPLSEFLQDRDDHNTSTSPTPRVDAAEGSECEVFESCLSSVEPCIVEGYERCARCLAIQVSDMAYQGCPVHLLHMPIAATCLCEADVVLV